MTIYEDPTHERSIVIERWIVRLKIYYPDLLIQRVFYSQYEHNAWIVESIRTFQAACPQGTFIFVHRIKEMLFYQAETLTWEDLEDYAHEVGHILLKKSFTWTPFGIEAPMISLERDQQLLFTSNSFNDMIPYIEKVIPKMTPLLTDSELIALFDHIERLNWEELLFIYQEQKDRLQSIIERLFNQQVIKMRHLGSTILIKTPATTYCCEGDECCCQF